MSYITTPRRDVKAAIQSILSETLPDVTVHTSTPERGVARGEVRISVEVETRDWSIGEWMGDGIKGMLLPFKAQIDVWELTAQSCEALLDQIIDALHRGRSTARSNHDIYDLRITRTPEPWQEDRFWHGVVEVIGEYKVTKP